MADTFFGFFSAITERNSMKLEKKASTQSTLLSLWGGGGYRKTKMLALASDWLRHFQILVFFSETAERNSRKLDGKQDLNILPKVCILGWLENQNGRHGLWLDETFPISSLQPLFNENWQKEGSQCRLSRFVELELIRKQRYPWLLIGWGIFNFFSTNAEQNSTKLDRKQDLNFLFQHCVSRTDDQKIKMAALASDWQLQPFVWIQRNWTERNIPTSSSTFVDFGPVRTPRWPPWYLNDWDIFDFSATAEQNSTTIYRKQGLDILYQVCVFRANCEI